MTHTCTCGTTLDFVRGFWDGADADGNRAVWIPDHWVCPNCCVVFVC